MKPDEFEKRLSSQPLKPIPGEWREEILAAAQEAKAISHPSSVIRHSWFSTIRYQVSALLWPHPRAWAGLAALWFCIFLLNFSTRDSGLVVVAVKSAPPSPEMVSELRQQHRMLAELIGSVESRVADRQPLFSPKPRSSRAEILAV